MRCPCIDGDVFPQLDTQTGKRLQFAIEHGPFEFDLPIKNADVLMFDSFFASLPEASFMLEPGE